MRTVRVLTLLALVAFGLTAFPQPPATACWTEVCTDDDTLLHDVDVESQEVRSYPGDDSSDGSGGGGGGGEPTWMYSYVPQATEDCDDATSTYMQTFRKPYGAGDARQWELWEEGCVLPDQITPFEVITTSIHERIERQVDHPKAQVRPGDGEVFVNLPVIAWSQPADPISFDLEHPVPGTVRATPHWEWRFISADDTNIVDEDWPGRPYDGTDPRDDPDHYVTNVYDHIGPGSAEVTMRWDVTFEYYGLGHELEVTELEPLVLTDTVEYEISEAKPVLTR